MNDFRIPVFVEGPHSVVRPERPGRPDGVASFSDQLGDAMSAVDTMQVEGDRQADKLAAGGGNLHETAMALEKADVAMRVAMKVRNKLVDAYHEVMRMSV